MSDPQKSLAKQILKQVQDDDRIKRLVVIPAQAGILKRIALRLFISFPMFRSFHEHSMLPNQIGNDEPTKITS